MAEMTIHPWDKISDTKGAAMAIRDQAGYHIREAKLIIEHCKRGGSRTIQVPFAKKLLLSSILNLKGFLTS